MHSLTHFLYRTWCIIFLRAKARGSYYRQQYDKRPLLQDDHGFLVDKVTKQEDIPVLWCLLEWRCPFLFHRRVSLTSRLQG